MATNNPQGNPFTQAGRSEELYHPNDIRIESIIIRNGVREVDVTGMMIQFNLFEDLYSNVLTANLTLVDSVNLIGVVPFVGLEQVEIVFKTPGFLSEDATELVLNVYQISDRNTGSAVVGTDATQTYTMQLISPAYFRSQQNRVRKAYVNEPISQMVSKIVGNFLGEDVEFEETAGQQSYVIPSWTPFRAVNWLASRARPAANPQAANYLFFETAGGFQFRSIDSIVQDPPVIRLTYAPANTRLTSDSGSISHRQIMPEMQMIRSYTILPSGSTMERIDQGMFASKLITHDLVTKEFATETYSYTDAFDGQNHIEDTIYGDNNDTTPSDPKPFAGSAKHGRKYDSSVKIRPKHREMFDGVQDYDESEKWLLQRMSQMRQVEAQRVKVEVPGLNFLSVGQLVILEVPRPENTKGLPHPSDLDPEVSGNYIITNIHHIIELDDHKMIMELSKESLPASSTADEADILDAVSSAETFDSTGLGLTVAT